MGKASMQAGGIANSNEWEDAIEPYTVQRKRCTLVKKCFAFSKSYAFLPYIYCIFVVVRTYSGSTIH